jgi:hypothetical protein
MSIKNIEGGAAMIGRLITAGELAAIGGVLTWVVQSAAILTVGLLAGRLLRRRGPAVQSTLYRTLLVAVLLCPIASIALTAMGITGFVVRLPAAPENDAAVVALAAPPRDRLGPGAGREATTIPTLLERAAPAPGTEHTPIAIEPALAKGPASVATGPPALISTMTSSRARSPARSEWIGPAATIGVASWLFGSALLALALVVGHRRMSRLRRGAIRAENEAEALCHDLARRMRLGTPAVLRSPFLSSPCLDGLREPAILLPEDAQQNLRETFIHELAHLARRDGLWNLLRHLATAALWIQP